MGYSSEQISLTPGAALITVVLSQSHGVNRSISVHFQMTSVPSGPQDLDANVFTDSLGVVEERVI